MFFLLGVGGFGGFWGLGGFGASSYSVFLFFFFLFSCLSFSYFVLFLVHFFLLVGFGWVKNRQEQKQDIKRQRRRRTGEEE